MKETGRTLFVGGPRHGRTVNGTPEKEGELYRVPARSKKDEPVDYKATEVVLTFPDVLRPEQPGETYGAFVYVIPEAYPDNPTGQQNLQAGLPEACLRLYIMENGLKTSGGPQAVAAQRNPVFVAWCPDCDVTEDQAHEFDNRLERASYMRNHKETTGHTARWADKER